MTMYHKSANEIAAEYEDREKHHRALGAVSPKALPSPPIGTLTLHREYIDPKVYQNVSVEPIGSHGFLRVVSIDGLTRTVINPDSYDSAVFEEHQPSKETT